MWLADFIGATGNEYSWLAQVFHWGMHISSRDLEFEVPEVSRLGLWAFWPLWVHACFSKWENRVMKEHFIWSLLVFSFLYFIVLFLKIRVQNKGPQVPFSLKILKLFAFRKIERITTQDSLSSLVRMRKTGRSTCKNYWWTQEHSIRYKMWARASSGSEMQHSGMLDLSQHVPWDFCAEITHFASRSVK